MKLTVQTKKHLVVHGVLLLGAAAMFAPFLWMFVTSLKTLSESMLVPPTLWPDVLQWSNYADVWNSLPFAAFYANTFGMILFRVLGSVFFSATAAYAFARMTFPGRDALFGLVLVTMMIPGQHDGAGISFLRPYGLPRAGDRHRAGGRLAHHGFPLCRLRDHAGEARPPRPAGRLRGR